MFILIHWAMRSHKNARSQAQIPFILLALISLSVCEIVGRFLNLYLSLTCNIFYWPFVQPFVPITGNHLLGSIVLFSFFCYCYCSYQCSVLLDLLYSHSIGWFLSTTCFVKMMGPWVLFIRILNICLSLFLSSDPNCLIKKVIWSRFEVYVYFVLTLASYPVCEWVFFFFCFSLFY